MVISLGRATREIRYRSRHILTDLDILARLSTMAANAANKSQRKV